MSSDCAPPRPWQPWLAAAAGIETPNATPPLAYPWTPAALPGRPRTYLDNARLAAAVAAHLLGAARVSEVADEVVRTHQWPGRFEIAQPQPLVLLDGAHNPAGAATLAEDLRALSPAWTFVIGVSRGQEGAPCGWAQPGQKGEMSAGAARLVHPIKFADLALLRPSGRVPGRSAGSRFSRALARTRAPSRR